MGLFEEGDANCVKTLLRPAERVLRLGTDVWRESYGTRADLWGRIVEAYNRYQEGECGDFLRDLDRRFRAKFEGALALLAWSFERNGEDFEPAKKRFTPEELTAIERLFRYNVFEIYSKDDVMKLIMHRDNEVLSLLREYYSFDRWLQEFLQSPRHSLALRDFLKSTWDSYKEKINLAIAEATARFDWFRDFLEEAKKETEAVERIYRKKLDEKEKEVEKLKKAMELIRERWYEEIEKAKAEIESAKKEEIEALRRKNEELRRRFEEEKAKLIEEIARMKDEEMKARLEEELRKAEERMKAEVRALEERLRRRELELRQREMELRRRELELSKAEEEVRKQIEEAMKIVEKAEKGSRFIRSDEARIMEMNFAGRIRSKLSGELKLLGKTFKVESVEERETFDRSKYAGKLDEVALKNVPTNVVIEATLKEKKLLGKKENIILRAVYLSRPERYAEYGFDTDPVELAELNALLDDARREERRTVLLVASPTGFEKRILSYVASDDFHRNFVADRVSLLLLDLGSGEMIHNPNDPYAKAFAPLLRLEFDEELLEKARRFLLNRLTYKHYVRFDEAISELDLPVEIVRKAFLSLGKEGYVAKYVEGVGYVLVSKEFGGE
ncbi:hypothetical protein [Thermococcus sp.]|uniref:hypothetical protein n=1 Tax=Thermococcus sp. TaxID=35749 RepID=UPI00263782A5|nr:hypothetical protein [Thermococcus sp.]